MTGVYLGLLVILASFTAGCATQSYQDKPLAPGATFSGYEARTLDSAELRTFLEQNLKQETALWPPTSWDLDRLTLAAFYYHPDLDLARAKWGVAEAGIITAGQRPNPQLLPGLIQYNSDAPTGVSPWTIGAVIDIPIETAGKRGYRITQAKQQSQTARFQIASAAWQVRSRVRASLVELYPMEPILERQLTLQQEILKMLDRRLAVGLASQPEVTQARLSLSRIELTLNEIRKQRAEQRARLAAALGLPLNALNTVTLSLSALEQVPLLIAIPKQEAQRQALLNRPDILAALSEYETSQAALRLEIAKQYPDLHPQPGYTWDAGASKWALGLALELPILNRNEGPVAEAKARREQAAANFNVLQARAIGEVEQALAGYEFALGKLTAAEAALSGQRQSERATTAAFKAGEADRLQLVSAEFETASAEQARTEVFIQTQQSVGQLEDALQRPLNGTVLPLSQIDDPRQRKVPR